MVITSNKNIYAYRHTKLIQKPSILLVSKLSQNYAVTALELIYAGMAVTVLAKILILKGYHVSIKALFNYSHSQAGIIFHQLIPVKEFNETLDINRAAFVISDPRFFRWDVFASIFANYDALGLEIPPGIASVSDPTQFLEESYLARLGTDYMILGDENTKNDAVESVKNGIKQIIDIYARQKRERQAG